MELPNNWRTVITDMVRGASPLNSEWFTGGPRLSPTQQIQIYQEQYQFRLLDALIEELVGFTALSGDPGVAWLRDYLAAHPSTGWTLNDVALAFESFLEQQPGVPQEYIEMVALDQAVQNGFTAANHPPLNPSTLLATTKLMVVPSLRALSLTRSVHHYRASVIADEEPAEILPCEVKLVVFRVNNRMRHVEVEPAIFCLLRAFGAKGGATLESALLTTLNELGLTEEQAAPHLAQWTTELTANDWLCVWPGLEE